MMPYADILVSSDIICVCRQVFEVVEVFIKCTCKNISSCYFIPNPTYLYGFHAGKVE